jgi:hypothetical protein
MDQFVRDNVIQQLQLRQQPATYGALAGVCDGSPRTVMSGLLKVHTHSWVVNAATLVPTGYLPEQIDPRLFEAIAAKGVISDPVKLRACLSDPEA